MRAVTNQKMSLLVALTNSSSTRFNDTNQTRLITWKVSARSWQEGYSFFWMFPLRKGNVILLYESWLWDVLLVDIPYDRNQHYFTLEKFYMLFYWLLLSVFSMYRRTDWASVPLRQQNLVYELAQALATIGAVSIGIWMTSQLNL